MHAKMRDGRLTVHAEMYGGRLTIHAKMYDERLAKHAKPCYKVKDLKKAGFNQSLKQLFGIIPTRVNPEQLAHFRCACMLRHARKEKQTGRRGRRIEDEDLAQRKYICGNTL